MFLRRNRRLLNGESYDYWTLVKTVRTARGPRQQVVACLGKEPGLDSRSRHRWEDVADLLEGRAPTPIQGDFYHPFPEPSRPQWAQVDLKRLSVERVRDFGLVYLALALWRRLGLHQVLREAVEPGREEVPWDLTACILTLARFCDQRSELEAAQCWYPTNALDDLLGILPSQINDARLYRGLDIMLEHKDRLCAHLQTRYQTWFGVSFEFLLYDVTSTYFEGQARGNTKARRGYSRDQRPDCLQVNIGLVVTPEGLPIGYEVFDGNTADVSTVEAMVRLMEEKYGKAQRIWVLDRGMVSEDNLDFLRQRQAHYIVGTPKKQLKDFQAQLLETDSWKEVQPGVEVKLVNHPDGRGAEQYVLCRSQARRDKEAAMLEQARKRLRAQLDQLHASLQEHPAKDIGAVERKIGRWLGRFPSAERLIEVKVSRDEEGRAKGLEIGEKADRAAWAQMAHGAYLLRTNCLEQDASKVWQWYMQLTQAEECFRIAKSDMGLRPVYHQKTERVEAHILVCFLSLAMWRSLEQWMKSKGLGDCARQLIKEIATIKSMDVVFPVRETQSQEEKQMRLRLVAKPERRVAELLIRLGLELPEAAKEIKM